MTTAYAKAAQINTAPTVTEASKAIPFGRGRVPSAVAPIQKAPGAPQEAVRCHNKCALTNADGSPGVAPQHATHLPAVGTEPFRHPD